MSEFKRADVRLEREASGFVEREKYEALGWVKLVELPGPPAAGGPTYIMGWMSDAAPRFPEHRAGDVGPGGGV